MMRHALPHWRLTPYGGFRLVRDTRCCITNVGGRDNPSEAPPGDAGSVFILNRPLNERTSGAAAKQLVCQ